MINPQDAIAMMIAQRATIPSPRAMLVAISGIDGSGKGYVAKEIAAMLGQHQLRVANINIDGWLNLPHRRFSATNPAEHFYNHAIRFDELFAQLILPLRENRSVDIVADYAEETATEYRKHTYHFEAIDVILLEGIYLLQRQFCSYYDLAFWIECTFQTALERAIARAQEGLPPEETVKAYQTIYFPAQAIHFERDQPQVAATAIISNDPRLG